MTHAPSQPQEIHTPFTDPKYQKVREQTIAASRMIPKETAQKIRVGSPVLVKHPDGTSVLFGKSDQGKFFVYRNASNASGEVIFVGIDADGKPGYELQGFFLSKDEYYILVDETKTVSGKQHGFAGAVSEMARRVLPAYPFPVVVGEKNAPRISQPKTIDPCDLSYLTQSFVRAAGIGLHPVTACTPRTM